MLALMRDLGSSMTSTMVAGTRRTIQTVRPAGVYGAYPQHQSAKTIPTAPPIKYAESAFAITCSGPSGRRGGTNREERIGCLVTRRVPEVARILGGKGSGGGAWRGVAGPLPGTPASPRRLDPGSGVSGSGARAAGDCGASVRWRQRQQQ